MRTERKVVTLLKEEELTINEIAKYLMIPTGKLFHTLKELEVAGVVMQKQRNNRTVFYINFH